MKRLASILFLLCAALSAHAALVITNTNVRLALLADSFEVDDTSPITGYRCDLVFASLARYYPSNNWAFANISRAGGNMEDQRTNQLHRILLPFAGWRTNNAQIIVLDKVTQNGSDNSNATYLSLSNNFLAPGIMSPGDASMVSVSGWAANHPYQWYALGDYPEQSLDGGSATAKSRDDAATNAGPTFGRGAFAMWGILRPSFTNDYGLTSGANVGWFTAPKGGHPGNGGHTVFNIEMLKQLLPDTNVADASIDWSGTINSTNHCVLSSASRSGNTLTFQRTDDRLPPVIEFPGTDGRGNAITNDGWLGFNLIPADGNAFWFGQKITSLPAGSYSVAIDGTNVGTLSSTLLGTGWNMWTNRIGSYAQQASATTADVRTMEYVDPVTLLPGSGGDGLGWVSFSSTAFGRWQAGDRGDTLIASMTAKGDLLSTNYATIHTAAQPTSHTFNITLIVPVFAPFHR